MIFADLKYDGPYEDIHGELFSFIKAHFDEVQGGLQGDSWIQISSGEDTVAVDTFLSMTHQIKSSRPCKLVESVIAVLQRRYEVFIYPDPELEPHEDEEPDGSAEQGAAANP